MISSPSVSSGFAAPSSAMREPPAPRAALAAVFLAVLVGCFASGSLYLFGVAAVAASGLVFAYAGVFAYVPSRERAVLLLVACAMTALLPMAAWRGWAAIAHYVVVMTTLLGAYVLTRDLSEYLKAARAVLLMVIGVVLIYVQSVGAERFPLENLIPGSSSNGITSYLIALQAHYCVINYAVNRRPAFVTPLLTLVVCVIGYGRGSILVAVGIIAANALTLLSPRRPGRAVLSGLAIAAMALWAVAKYGDDISHFVESRTKIGSGLHDPHRALQIREYLERIDGVTLLTGADYRGTSIAADYNNNPHNSYIRAHHIFGLPYLLLMLALPWLLQSSRLPVGVRIYMLAMLGLMLLRAVTEPILFPTLFDLLYFAACFALADRGVPHLALRVAR